MDAVPWRSARTRGRAYRSYEQAAACLLYDLAGVPATGRRYPSTGVGHGHCAMPGPTTHFRTLTLLGGVSCYPN